MYGDLACGSALCERGSCSSSAKAADKSAAEMMSVYHEDKDTLSSVSILPHGDWAVLC